MIEDGRYRADSGFRLKEVDISYFIKACCEVDIANQDMKGRAGVLYANYKEWCKKNLYRYIAPVKFSKAMKKKFRRGRDGNGIYYEGICAGCEPL